MTGKRIPGTRSEVIRCPNCGEDYSVTYKRCPFCDERSRVTEEYDFPEDEFEDEGDSPHKTGKRLTGGRRGGGYGSPSPVRIGLTILSLGVIVAAVWIVFNWVAPLVANSKIDPTPPPVATPPATAAVTPPSATPVTPGTVTTSPEVTTPSPEVTPTSPTTSPVITKAPAATKTPATNSGKTFTLNRSDFTLETTGETFAMKASGATGTVTWKSENVAIATVDAAGKVTAVAKGSTTITATASDGAVAKCIVRCSGGTAPDASKAPTASLAPSGTLKLNRTDFTLAKQGETFAMKVTGASGTPVWSIANTAVATMDGSGKVTAVAKGQTTITCTVDGQTLTCIVRCTF